MGDEREPVDPAVEEAPPTAAARPALSRAGRAVRGLAADVSPLRTSRDYRLLWFGELVSETGRQIAIVAVFIQVFALTRSAAAVGLVGLVQVLPLMVTTVFGGTLIDRIDRRKLLLASQVGFAVASSILLVNSLMAKPSLVAVYVGAGLSAGFSGLDFPTRSAMTPNLVPRRLLAAALSLNQIMFNATMLVGPALGGVVIARLGISWAYGIDVVTYGATLLAASLMRPSPPKRHSEEMATGWAAVKEGFAFLKGRRVLQSTFTIDLVAMIFGMPRALFPVLAARVFDVGPAGVGLLYAAPAAGAFIAAAASGWVGRVRRQGRAVLWAVSAWGLGIVAFGLSEFSFPLALVFLMIAGGADMISAVFRSAILLTSVPDSLRGRLSAIHMLVVAGGPRLGDAEAGAVAALVSPVFSVVSGGLACLLGVGVIALLVPQFARYRAGDDHRTAPPGH